jgi:NAD(P)-dependent dehydrogenase (short-subunit alcohol dehydrogenase family)
VNESRAVSHNTRSFAGKVALVAGASRGIGAVTAAAFAQAGAMVVLAARDARALDAVAQRIRAAGGQVLAVPTDVGDVTSVEHLVSRTMNTFGRLDAAFNNATDGPLPAPLADIDPADFDRGIRTNIRGTFLGMKYQIPAMLRSGGGAIVNMASGAGLSGVSNLAAYVAGKAGIIGLTKVAALDYADHGIRVNVLAPGPILTHHLERAGEEAQRQAALSTPMGRIGRAEEVAATVLWLCSAQSSFITGVTVPIDGGQSAGLKSPRMYRQGHAPRVMANDTDVGGHRPNTERPVRSEARRSSSRRRHGLVEPRRDR